MLILNDDKETNLKVTMRLMAHPRIGIYYGDVCVGKICTATGKFHTYWISPSEEIILKRAGVELEVRDGNLKIKVS